MRPAKATFVTDTHPFVWYAAGEAAKLGSEARTAFEAVESGKGSIVLPSIALAEVMFLAEKGRVTLQFEQLIETLQIAINYRVYPLYFDMVKKASELRRLSEIHDRLITATAIILELDLISNDKEIRNSGYVRTIW